MELPRIAQVAVEGAAYHFDKLYDYLLPFDMADARPGCRVMVPFGRGNRKRQGVILAVRPLPDHPDRTVSGKKGESTAPPPAHLKPAVALLDREPLLNQEMLRLAVWLKEHTFCTYFDAVRVLLPAGISLRLVASYQIAPEVDRERLEALPPDARRLAGHLFDSGGAVERDRLLEVMGLSADSPLPDQLVGMGILRRTDDAVRRVGDATIRMVRLLPAEETPKLTPKQGAVVEFVAQAGTASVREVCYFAGVTEAVVSALCKKGVLELYEQETLRTPAGGDETADDAHIVLTDAQQGAFETLWDKYLQAAGQNGTGNPTTGPDRSAEAPPVPEEGTEVPGAAEKRRGPGGAALLYGVTGSGKTQVFLKLVDRVAAAGRGVIVMVPEIALTPQTLSIFRRRYGKQVAVFHSAMSLGQRMDEWKRVKRGEARIAIGTRSAVFAPFDDLGLIIMDEEQEHTYKSESSPRFHARDVARFRCAYHGGLLVLASATPSIESFTAARAGRYALCRLPKRYGAAVLPQVVTVDMREELSDGNTAAVSGFLLDRLRQTLDGGGQAILLLNRRGYNTFVSCRSCGHVLTCPHCSISMTYHAANGRLMCHYCGYSQPYAEVCPACGGRHVRYAGVGTQRVEDELSALFPQARILRMDADSTMRRDAYEKHLSAFAAGEYDLMLGTQMVAKGLNFPRVTLVGVLSADQAMYAEDYRGFERAFSLLTQVVGRSGRGEEPGMAVIQTVNPDNAIIRLAQAQDYDAFYEQEILNRKLMVYPPYCDIGLAGFVSEDKEAAKEGALWFLDQIKGLTAHAYADVRVMVLGPSPATVPKVSNKYRYRMLIKCRNTARFREMMRLCLERFGREFSAKKASAFLDMNPEGIL